MSQRSPSFSSKPVLDWNHERIGTIVGTQLSRGTREPTSILVALEPRIREQLGTETATLWLPYERVFSIRKGEVRLSRPVLDLVPEQGPVGVLGQPSDATVRRSLADALVDGIEE